LQRNSKGDYMDSISMMERGNVERGKNTGKGFQTPENNAPVFGAEKNYMPLLQVQPLVSKLNKIFNLSALKHATPSLQRRSVF